MQLLHDTHIDFMKYRKVWIGISTALMAVGALAILTHGKLFRANLNVGIDFAGGTQLTLRFQEHPDVDRLRKIMEQAGVGDATIQRFGPEQDNQVIIKTPAQTGNEEGNAPRVIALLNQEFNAGAGGFDLNQQGKSALSTFLLQADPDNVKGQGAQKSAAHYDEVADAILQVRRASGIITSLDALAKTEGVSPATVALLKAQAHLGKFALLSIENVGPQVGSELQRRGMMAILWSVVAVAVYIAFRFELRFGIGATAASLHDVLVTLGLFTLFGFEFNMTTIAAFLTLVGYSVYDTVVTFDRVRENLRKSRGEPLIEVMNRSINQTLSRTILTGGTAFLTAVSLLALGGDVLRGFAFILTVGVVVGTYSSIYIASPFTLLWENYFGARGKFRRQATVPVRTSAPPKQTPKTPGKGSTKAAGGRR